MKNSVKVLGLLAIVAGGCAQAPEGLSPQQRQARHHNSLGVVAMDQHNYVRGRDQFETATRLDPAYATAHANLGISLYKSRKGLGRHNDNEALYDDKNHRAWSARQMSGVIL